MNASVKLQEQLTVGDIKRLTAGLLEQTAVQRWLRFPDLGLPRPGYTSFGTANRLEVRKGNLVVLGHAVHWEDWTKMHPDVPYLNVGTLRRFVDALPDNMGVEQGAGLVSKRAQTESLLEVSHRTAFVLYAMADRYEE